MTLRLTDNALTVLKARYLNRDRSGQILESPEDLCRRVSERIAQAEGRFGSDRAVVRWQEAFFQALTQLDFVPNSPTLMNAGTSLGQLKGITVFRYGSKGQQVLELDDDEAPDQHEHFAKCDPHACDL